MLLLVFGTFAGLIGYAYLREGWARKGKIEPIIERTLIAKGVEVYVYDYDGGES